MALSISELELIQDRDIRDRHINYVDVLDKVKKLAMLPDDIHVTAQMVANYYAVGKGIIDQLAKRNKDELLSDGMKMLRSEELREYKVTHLHDVSELKRVPSLALYPRRAVLRIGMLLRDSDIAKQVRTYLLNVEEKSSIDQKQETLGEMKTPDTFLDALKLCVTLEEKRIETQNQLESATKQLHIAKPKIETYDKFLTAENNLTIEQVAKSFGWGRNKLFKFLRDLKVLKYNNTPMQRYINNGCFNVRVVPVYRNGETFNHTQTLVTSKGHLFVKDLVAKHNIFSLQR